MPLIALGRVLRPHGVHGAVLISLYNQGNPESVLEAPRLWLMGRDGEDPAPVQGLSGKLVPKGVIAKIKGFSTREAAETLKGLEIAIDRKDLPDPEEDEFYHADLLGLAAVTSSGRNLGKIESLMENGAGLVLVVVGESGKESLIPFTDECVPEVNLAGGLIRVSEIPGLFE